MSPRLAWQFLLRLHRLWVSCHLMIVVIISSLIPSVLPPAESCGDELPSNVSDAVDLFGLDFDALGVEICVDIVDSGAGAETSADGTKITVDLGNIRNIMKLGTDDYVGPGIVWLWLAHEAAHSHEAITGTPLLLGPSPLLFGGPYNSPCGELMLQHDIAIVYCAVISVLAELGFDVTAPCAAYNATAGCYNSGCNDDLPEGDEPGAKDDWEKICQDDHGSFRAIPPCPGCG